MQDLHLITEDTAGTVRDNHDLAKFKSWFSEAVEKSKDWRREAKEDVLFYEGKQWDDADRDSLLKAKRPALTINRIKPLMNVLTGYQRLNRYDIDFLGRTSDDQKKAELRKGITKYVMDRSHYNYEESDVFFDGVITGVGWFEVGYQFDYEAMDGDAYIRRISPFDMYVDPESRDRYYRDAKFIVRGRWVDKEELATNYPEHKEEIEAQVQFYLSEETESSDTKLWWQRETKKVRFAECWYKTTSEKTIYFLADGSTIEEATPEMIELGMVEQVKIPKTEVRLMAFFDNVVLEDKASPYEHGELPYVPFLCYYMGEDDIPAGVVRGLKDSQREINKRRSQELHLLNTQSNGGWMYEQGSMTAQQIEKFKENAATPGAMLEVAAGAMTGGQIHRLEPQGAPANLMNATAEAINELPAISGINESLMGTDVSQYESGRSIELKQKQAITHIAGLFDNLRNAKERIAYLLWGKPKHKGVIPQFYTEEKTIRITMPNGEQVFEVINQKAPMLDANQQPVIDPNTMQVVTQTLNDMSVGEYDIVVSDAPAAATQRTANFWSLVDACGKLGIQGTMVLDILLDLSDIPEKDTIKQRLQAQKEQEAQAQQAQQQAVQQEQQFRLMLEREKNINKNMSFKDMPLYLQLQMASEAGIFPKEYADAFLQWTVQQFQQQYGINPAVMQQMATQPAPPNQYAGGEPMADQMKRYQDQRYNQFNQAEQQSKEYQRQGLADAQKPVM